MSVITQKLTLIQNQAALISAASAHGANCPISTLPKRYGSPVPVSAPPVAVERIQELSTMIRKKINYLHSELIAENPETLLARLNEAKEEENQGQFKRIRALYLIRTKQCDTQKELSKIIGCDRTTINDWIKRYQEKGLDELLKNPKSSRLKFIEGIDWEIDVSPTQVPKSLRPGGLARRLGVQVQHLANVRHRRLFSRWTQQQDPDSIAWVWNQQDQRYYQLP